MSSLVNEVLTKPSEALPIYLSSFRIDVAYNEGMAPDKERREVLQEAFAELEEGLYIGFFTWARFATRRTADIDVRWNDRGDMSVVVSSEGVHYNGLVAALRIVARLHHSSRARYEALRTLLGDDADALTPPTTFRENVASLAISGVRAAEPGVVATTDVLNFTSEGIGLPAYAPLQGDVGEDCEGDRLIVTSSAEDKFPVGKLSQMEDCFLRLHGSGVFTSIDDLDQEVSDNEPEIFKRKRSGLTELVLGDYSDQKYGVIEFLNVVSGGQLQSLAIRSENAD